MSGFINFDERVALVTGAGSRRGIGFWTAKLIGLNGGKVVLVSTRSSEIRVSKQRGMLLILQIACR